ncbi:MAG: hypothetical protein ACQESJ_10595 [Bacteroidota bacterium]
MTEKIEYIKATLSYIRKQYRRGMIATLILGFILVFGYGYFRDYLSFSENFNLISKSILIIIFLAAIPVMVTMFNQKLRSVPLEWSSEKKLKRYRSLFMVKIGGLITISVLALIVFFLTGEYEMLVFWVAAVLFLYFDRPGYEKIQEDLRIEQNRETENEGDSEITEDTSS